MEDDANIRKLTELIFSKHFKNTEETTSPDALFTNNFIRRLQGVLCVKQLILNSVFQSLIMECSYITSHHMYLIFVMFACLSAHKCHKNIFESFICVFVLVKLVSDGVLKMIGMDFTDLNTDVFMVFYDHVLKSAFYKNGGFRMFEEYINGHKYLKWNWEDSVSPDHSTKVKISKDIEKEIEKGSRRYVLKNTEADEETRKAKSISMALKVLSNTSLDLSNSRSNSGVIKRQKESRVAKKSGKTEIIPKTTERFVVSGETSGGCSSLGSGSITNKVVNQYEDNAWYEKTIHAVMKYNHSRSLGYKNSDNRILKEVDGVLEHLKDTIRSLITVLDSFDRE